MLESSEQTGRAATGAGPRMPIHLDDEAARDPAIVGQKAANLARLRAEGYPVPAGFAIPIPACDAILSSADAEDERPTLPADLATAIDTALELLGDGPLAVRSSARAEDGARASFAGQFETVLNVRGADGVRDAITRCVASVRNAHALAYRRSAGDGAPGMAVLVQRMVDAEAAGVAFSAHPVTGDRDETLVHAVRGLGDRLVSGEATPDEWIARGDEIEQTAAPEGALDGEQARDVAALADSLEARLGAPQDIEWALTDGHLHLLQARPITALPRPPRFEVPPGTWLKDTVHNPRPVTPLGASIYLPALEEGIRTMCAEFGLVLDRVEQRSFGGEVYGRPVPVGEKEGTPPPWWLMALLVRLVPPLRRRMTAARRAVRSGLLESLPRRWDREWREELRTETERVRAVDLAALSNDDLERHLDSTIDFLHRGQRVHFRLFLPYAVPVRQLVGACEELLGWSDLEAFDLLAGLSEASSEPARALRALADRVRASPAARQVVQTPGPDLLERLEAADRDLAAAFADYRDRYGWRSTEYDAGAPTLAERPELIARLLADAAATSSSDELETQLARRRERAEARARAALAKRSARDRRRFEDALARARKVYPLREDNIFWTDNLPCGLIRATALEIGRRLVRAGRLDAPDDAVYLEVDELRDALRDRLPDARARSERRRAERAYTAAHPGPAHHGPPPSPPPDVRGFPAEGRLINESMMWFMDKEFGVREPDANAALSGTAASPGTYTGTVRVIRDESAFDRLRPGDVLVCPVTTPVWSVLFGNAGALVTDGGSVVSHAAIVAREHGIPAVVGTGTATRELRDGQTVTVNGSAGLVVSKDDDGSRST